MIFGHMPAGYLIARFAYRRLGCDAVSRAAFVLAGLVGAIAPDFDLAYFYLIDGRQHHHHTYFTHFPVMWAALLVVSVLWFSAARFRFMPALAFVFSLNGLVHMALDSIVGDIAWRAPWDMRFFSLFHVRSMFEPWWLNFILHWSFALELAIVVCAYCVWRSSLDGDRIRHLLELAQFHLLRLRAVPIRPKD